MTPPSPKELPVQKANKRKPRGEPVRNPGFPIAKVMEVLRREISQWPTPVVTVYSENRASPYHILIATLISLRTQDKTTAEASARLFELAETPQMMLELEEDLIARAVYPAGFYRNKARTIMEVSRRLIEDYGGKVPDTVEELVKLKGVGRKTANLVVTLGHGKPGICVDTHVHRIPNRWGWLETSTPEMTEDVLREHLPKKYWIPINDWLVTFGQNICKPTSPLCSQCCIKQHCEQVGLRHSR